MAQRGRQPNTEGTGALKITKSVQNQANPKRLQKTRFQATKINQSKETPKTKERPTTKTAIHGQMSKTKCHRPHNPNQIGNHTDQLARKNTTESVKKKLILQFGFIADPSHSSHHNASNALADTPTWY